MCHSRRARAIHALTAHRFTAALKRAAGRGARSRVSMPGGAVLWQSCSSHRGRAPVKRAHCQYSREAAAERARTGVCQYSNLAILQELGVLASYLECCSISCAQDMFVHGPQGVRRAATRPPGHLWTAAIVPQYPNSA